VNSPRPRFSKKELDERRAKNNLIPGTSLKPTAEDDRIPILVVRRPLGFDNSSDSSSTLVGWRLYVPWHFSTAFFASLVYSPLRVGGLQQLQQQHFEAGEPYFPRDWPPSRPCLDEEERHHVEKSSHWDRRPPAKRENFRKLGTKEPFKAGWHALVKLEEGKGEGDEGEEEEERPWLLRGPLLEQFLDRLVRSPSDDGTDAQTILDDLLAQHREKRFGSPTSENAARRDLSPPRAWVRKALVRVRVLPCGRGAPDDLAVIYGLGEEEWGNVKTELRETRQRQGLPEQDDVSLSLCVWIGNRY
jgi:ribonuclease P/MRP protein subunit POP1